MLTVVLIGRVASRPVTSSRLCPSNPALRRQTGVASATTAVVFPTQSGETGPIYHQRQAGTERSDATWRFVTKNNATDVKTPCFAQNSQAHPCRSVLT